MNNEVASLMKSEQTRKSEFVIKNINNDLHERKYFNRVDFINIQSRKIRTKISLWFGFPRKAEPKRYNVDLVSYRVGLRVFRKPFFVVDYRRYSLLFGVIRTMTARKNQRDKKRYRQDLNLRHIS